MVQNYRSVRGLGLLAFLCVLTAGLIFGASAQVQQGKVYRKQGGAELVIASGGLITVQSGGEITGRQVRHTVKSKAFNLDNGAGATLDDVLLRPSSAITITAARIVYSDATSGTVAAGNVTVGTTVNGEEIVAETAYENSKAVGTTTALTIVSGAVAAATPVIVRHTGVAITQAGEAYVELEYTIDA